MDAAEAVVAISELDWSEAQFRARLMANRATYLRLRALTTADMALEEAAVESGIADIEAVLTMFTHEVEIVSLAYANPVSP